MGVAFENNLQQEETNYTQGLLNFFLLLVLVLSLFGVLMVYSSSFIYSKEVFNRPDYFFMKQVGFFGISILSALVIGKTKLSFWMKYIEAVHIFLLIFLFLTIIPGVGYSLKGAYRWVKLGPVNFQPSEFVKLTTMLYALSFLTVFEKLDSKKFYFSITLLVFPLLIFLKQPDFGTFAIIVFLIFYLCFLGPVQRKFFYGSFLVCLVSLGAILFSAPYRVQRLLTFLDPWKDPKASGFQIIQSYLALANGSVLGKGIGNSHEKLFYLPEAHNDFIFSVVGEELGLVGVTLVVFIFIALMGAGLLLAIKMKNRTHMMLVSSVTFLITIQAFLNMAVVLGILPTKGLNLPFISYGGSSLLTNFMMVGIMIATVREDQKSSVLVTPTTTSSSSTSSSSSLNVPLKLV